MGNYFHLIRYDTKDEIYDPVAAFRVKSFKAADINRLILVRLRIYDLDAGKVESHCLILRCDSCLFLRSADHNCGQLTNFDL